MPLKITPVALPEALRAELEDPPADPEDLRERFTSHGRTFSAVGWGWSVTFVDGERVTVRRRLEPGSPRRGDLRWCSGRATTRLEKVLGAQLGKGEMKGWDRVHDWSVAPSGERLLCITGYEWVRGGRGSSGALYAVDLTSGVVTRIHRRGSAKEGVLRQVVALADDEALLLDRDALRWFRLEGKRWAEIARRRVTRGVELSAGVVEGRRVAAVRSGEHGRSLYFALEGKRLVPLGEVLRPARRVVIREGRALVHVDDRWHAVSLPAAAGRGRASTRGAASAGARTIAPHPLHKATITVQGPAKGVTPLSRARAAKLGACDLGPRLCGRGVAAGIARGYLLVDRDRQALRRIKAPKETLAFDVSADGRVASVIHQRAPFTRALMTREVDGRGPWREIKVDAPGLCGPEVLAHLGDAHLVVRSSDALELLRHGDAGWATVDRKRCPLDSTLLAIPGRACVLVASATTLTFYGERGDRLVKLTTGRIPGRSSIGRRPEAFVRADGALFVDGWRIDLGPAST